MERMFKNIILAMIIAILGRFFVVPLMAQQIDRRVLPPLRPEFKGNIANSYKDSTPDWRPWLPITAPDGAPNIVLIVLDDVGYSQLGSYGGAIGAECSLLGMSFLLKAPQNMFV